MVIIPTIKGHIIPGKVAIVFDIPNRMPEKGPDMSLILTKWAAPKQTEL